MQDPSSGVQQPLEKHLHLLSKHTFPQVAQMNVEQAFKYLLDAADIVKQVDPVSWQYVGAPQDGTVWLEWLGTRQNGGRYPTDGYVWGDPEQTFRHEINGYVIELMMHQCGFRPGMDHLAEHARTRYHFIAKAANVNAAQPDPCLWIVHYHHAQQQRIMPVQQVPLQPYMRQLMHERQWLEGQGRIERREFMLHDRGHWPTITLPGTAQHARGNPTAYGNTAQSQAMMQRYGPPYPQPGQHAAKRQRVDGPPMEYAAEEEDNQYDRLEAEEMTVWGDFFDTLSPQQISLVRWTQHNEWMEEVVNRSVAASAIVPADLGLGLMGSLKGLTDGIVAAPDLDSMIRPDAADNADAANALKEAEPFTHLKQGQIDEFNSRVQKHLEEGRAEIQRMKAEHNKRMKEWRITNKITRAEQQLRHATWVGHESALYQPSGKTNENGTSSVDDIVASVEQLTGLKVKSHKDAVLIEKGGLEEERQVIADATTEHLGQQLSNAPSVAPSEAISFQQDSAAQAAVSQAQTTSGAIANGTSAPQTQSNSFDDTNQGVAEEFNLDDNMDLDNDLNFDLGNTPGQNAPEMQPSDATATISMAINQDSAAITSGNTAAVEAEQQKSGGTNAQALADATNNANAASGSNDDSGEAAMFNDNGFDFANELGGTNDDVGDELIDFGGDEGIGMDSAFGDAIHGMDTEEGS